MRLKIYNFFFLCAFSASNMVAVFGQTVQWNALDSTAEVLLAKEKNLPQDGSLQAIEMKAQRVISQWMRDAYWLAEYSTDSVEGHISVALNAGPKFAWKQLELDSNAQWILDRIKTKPLSSSSPMQWVEDILMYYENNGLPFAAVSFDSIVLEGGDLSAAVSIDPGPYIRIDSIAVKGFNKLKRPFFRYELGVYPGQLYSEAKIKEMSKRMDRVEHLNFAREPQVLFSEEKTIVYIYVEEEKNNAFSGIAGLNSLPEGGVTITGEVDVRLLNSIKQGEDLEIRWRRPGEEMQMLDVQLSVPYPFHLPLALDGEIHFLRQDSSFFNLQTDLGVQFIMSKNSRLRLFYESRSSSVLSQDPGIAGVSGFRSQFLRLGFTWNSTNHFILPTKGMHFYASGGNGRRTAENESQAQWITDGFLAFYQPIIGRFGIYGKSMFGLLYGNDLLANEVFRVGGIKTMRGFNEQSLFASGYFIQNFEFRYAIDRFSFFQLLGDFGLVENSTAHLSGRSTLFAMGAGMSFRTEVGVLNLIYAVGKTGDRPFDFPAAKIHIGYINRF